MDIVWFAEIKWDYLKTRKQQIIRRKPADVRLLYLEPFVKGRVNRFDLRREDDILCATVPFLKAAPGGVVEWVLEQPWGRWLVDRNARSRVSRLFRRAGFAPSQTGLVVSNVYAINVARRIPGRFLLYDCNDVHTAFPGMPGWTHDYFNTTCRRADAVFTSSRALFGDVTGIRGGETGCELIGNGVEYGHFRAVREAEGWPDPPDPPRIGYLGAIAPWFDFDHVGSVARAHPDWEVVLVGPVMLGVEDRVAALTELPNVTRREPVAYEDVPRLLRGFTVGLIPFRYDDLTRGVNPNKMYEYLAMGLPVVATKFSEEVGMYPEVVKAADSAEEFIRACEQFVHSSAEASQLARHRQLSIEIAAQNDWEKIAKNFWKSVSALESRRA
jgi:glycosyltransferase involved in cell wall biosynthesis